MGSLVTRAMPISKQRIKIFFYRIDRGFSDRVLFGIYFIAKEICPGYLKLTGQMYSRQVRNCKNCGEAKIPALANGNRRYCDECKRVQKLEYNRHRSAAIRESGNIGLHNLKLLDHLTNHGTLCPVSSEASKLNAIGIDLNSGWKRGLVKGNPNTVLVLGGYFLELVESNKTIRITHSK